MNIRGFQSKDTGEVVELWKTCGLVVPHNNPIRDIERKLKVNPEWFLVGDKGGKIVATCMAGYEGHRGWNNYLAVLPTEQKKGYARYIMEHAEMLLKAAGCPKVNLQIRASNTGVIEFYKSIGYQPDDAVSMGRRLEPDI